MYKNKKHFSRKVKTLRESLKNRYITVYEINSRLNILRGNFKGRGFSPTDKLEFMELQKLRSRLRSNSK